MRSSIIQSSLSQRSLWYTLQLTYVPTSELGGRGPTLRNLSPRGRRLFTYESLITFKAYGR